MDTTFPASSLLVSVRNPEALRKDYPEVDWMTYEKWTDAQDWSPVAASNHLVSV